MITDPNPTMSWDELVHSELIFEAVCEGQDPRSPFVPSEGKFERPQKLTLRITRPLKGDIKAGETVPIALEHWWSVVTRPIDRFWGLRDDDERKDDGIPRLCYQHQPMNPGGLADELVHPDMSRPLLYFIEKSGDRKIERWGQIRSALFADDWEAVLSGNSPSPLFLILQSADPIRSLKAIEALDFDRDPADLKALLDAVATPSGASFDSWSWEAAVAVNRLSDVEGDLYERTRQRVISPPPRPQPGPGELDRFLGQPDWGHSYGTIMAQLDAGRATEDAGKWLESKEASPELRARALTILGSRKNAEAFRIAAALAQDPITMAEGIRILGNGMPQLPTEETRKVEDALAQLVALPSTHWEIPGDAESSSWNQRYVERIERLLKFTPAPPLLEAEIKEDESMLESAIAALEEKPDRTDWDAIRPISGKLERWKSACDLRVMPPLVRLGKQFPVRKSRAGIDSALSFYEKLDPAALRLELDRQDAWEALPHFSRLPVDSESTHYWLRRDFAKERAREAMGNPAVTAHFDTVIAEIEAEDWPRRTWDQVEALYLIDPARGNHAIDTLLARRETLYYREQRDLLNTAVKCGRKALVPAMLEADRLTEEESQSYAKRTAYVAEGRFRPELLLLADTEEATSEYLRLLDRQLESTRLGPIFRGFFYRSLGPAGLPLQQPGGSIQNVELSLLFPQNSPAFFERVIRLLESPEPLLRMRGQMGLTIALQWQGDLDYGLDIGRRREAILESLIPRLRHLASLESELEIRSQILRFEGLELKGEPGPAWYPELVAALMDQNHAELAHNVMRVAELMIKRDGPVAMLRSNSHPDRWAKARYLEVFFEKNPPYEGPAH